MRTKSERILLAVLVAFVFVAGNYYGYRWLAQRQASLQMAYAGLKADQAEAEVDLQQTDLWAKRKTWVEANEPVLGDEGEAKGQVQEFVKKGASDHKLEIVEQSLNDSEHGPAGTSINVSIKVKGAMQDICEWLTELQKPGQFYAISLFSLRADQDQKSMICTLKLTRYFKGG